MTTAHGSNTLEQLVGETVWLRRLAGSLVADQAADRIKLHRLLAGYVLELSPSQRDVVLLHYVQGLTSIEIGNRLGIAAGRVRSILKHAVDELRDRLDAESPNRAWLAPMIGLAKDSGAATASASSIVLAAMATVAVIVALLVRVTSG